MAPALVGLIFVIGAVGSLAGSLVAGRIAARLGLGTTILGAMIIACSVYLAIPFVNGSSPITVGSLALVLGVAGASIAITVIHVMTIRQTVTPNHLLARMNASYRTLGYGVMPVGALLGGVIGEMLGLRAAVVFRTARLTGGDQRSATLARVAVQMSWPPEPGVRLESNTTSRPFLRTFGRLSLAVVLFSSATGAADPQLPSEACSLA